MMYYHGLCHPTLHRIVNKKPGPPLSAATLTALRIQMESQIFFVVTETTHHRGTEQSEITLDLLKKYTKTLNKT